MSKDYMNYFSSWSKERLLKTIDIILNEHERLKRIPFIKDSEFRKLKRDFLQDVTDSIYYELILKNHYLKIELNIDDINYLEEWAQKYTKYKLSSGEVGYRVDRNKIKWRAYNGACGHLAVLKALGGTYKDINLDIGNSKEYNVPDLLDWLHFPVGVKTSTVINFASPSFMKFKNTSNLPLVLDYRNYIHKFKTDNKIIEPQIMVGTKEFRKSIYDFKLNKSVNKPYKMVCFIWGIASPKVLINGNSIAFTLDPNASDSNKPGGAKAGFYDLYKTTLFRTKEELVSILKTDEFSSIPYENIKNFVDLDKIWDYNTKQLN